MSEKIEGREVIRRFAAPPAFEGDDEPDEIAVVRIPILDGAVMVCGRLLGRWIPNYGERAAVRFLLEENERLRAALDAIPPPRLARIDS